MIVYVQGVIDMHFDNVDFIFEFYKLFKLWSRMEGKRQMSCYILMVYGNLRGVQQEKCSGVQNYLGLKFDNST